VAPPGNQAETENTNFSLKPSGTEEGEIIPELYAGVSRRHSRRKQVRLVRHSTSRKGGATDRPSRNAGSEGPNRGRANRLHYLMDPLQQTSKRKLHLIPETVSKGWGAEGAVADCGTERSEVQDQVLEKVVESRNIWKAYKRVYQNKGTAGTDRMQVEDLLPWLQAHWGRVRASLLEGSYIPQPVLSVQIPKPGGTTRELGIPTVADRLIQQAILQVLQPDWDSTFSENSFGFRPGRSAHQAIHRAREYVESGKGWVIDMDIEKFFDRINHDKLMSLISKRVTDKRVLQLIGRYLKAGIMRDGLCSARRAGTPQGGPLSPLLSNLMLNELDRELERRGHTFVRYADDCNIYVCSKRAGNRVLASISRYLERTLHLHINPDKSAVTRPWRAPFLGFTIHRRKGTVLIRVSRKSLIKLKAAVRTLSSRTRGICMSEIIKELGEYLRGWGGYFRIGGTRNLFSLLDRWIRRRLRCYLWKQWGRRGYAELRKRGVPQSLAWNTSKSAHGPWRLSQSPALSIALPISFFTGLGLLSLDMLL